jgi:hypothetical protein
MSAGCDPIIVGTGFAGAFFLMRNLERAPAGARVLVLERGGGDSKAWQLQIRRTCSIAPEAVLHNLTPQKEWFTGPGFGGNSKCWAGGTTRMMMPRSRPFPLPPHRFSNPEGLLKKGFPDGRCQMATARASVATGKRGVCCASSDFFKNGADESRTVRYIGNYDPLIACGNPFAGAAISCTPA